MPAPKTGMKPKAKARSRPLRPGTHARPASSARRRSASANAPGRSRVQMPVLVLVGFGMAAAAVAAPGATSLVACGLLPGLVLFVLDGSEGQNTACTVGSLNVAGVAPFLPALLSREAHALPVANLLGDTTALIVMYAAAAVGWLLVALLPGLFAFLELQEIRQRREGLRRVQARLEEEWGPEVRGPDFRPPRPQASPSLAPGQR